MHAGLLAGALQAGSTDARIDAHRDQLTAYEDLCRGLGATPAAVAIACVRVRIPCRTAYASDYTALIDIC